ncbi:MAG: hypothetical protein WCC45_04135 [Paeniglutamicibacter sp.]
MGRLSTRPKMTMWAGMAISAALLLTGCGQAATSPGTTVPPSAAPASVTEASSRPSTPEAIESSPPSPTQATLETHKIANAHFQITMPSDWKLEKLTNVAAQVHKDSTASFKIVAADGRQLAEIRTGGEEIWDIVPLAGLAKNTVFDSAGDGEFGGLNYEFLSYDGQADQAEMMLTALDSDSAKTWGDRLESLIYAGGSGEFSAALTSKSVLPGVADSVKGAERFKAYAKTEEYSQLKKAMLSFKQLKDVVPAGSESATTGRCAGAKFTYELGDSGLSCDEAKTLLTRLLKQPIHTGAVELTGVGACMLPGPTQPGHCNVESTGGTFEFSMR